MGFFDKLFGKKADVGPQLTANTAEAKPKLMINTAEMTLENQNGVMNNVRDIDIENYLFDMFNDEDQFVTLSPMQPQGEIRFVQACQARGMIIVQLGMPQNAVIEKYCTQRECMDIFLHYYDTLQVENMEQYKPIELYRPK